MQAENSVLVQSEVADYQTVCSKKDDSAFMYEIYKICSNLISAEIKTFKGELQITTTLTAEYSNYHGR